jgi:hypothetical protein
VNARDTAQWLRFQRRVSSLSPESAKALLDAWNVIRDSLTPEEMERLINGDDKLLDRALLRYRAKVRSTIERGFTAAIPQLPKAGKVDGTVAAMFDVLNPKVIEAIRELDSRVINTLKDEIRETVKAFVENGIRDGKNPKEIARDLRPVVGMSPTQADNALKFQAKLEAKGLPAAKIERQVATYRRKAVALNAETNARTATVDSLKLGQHLTWQDAADKGIVDLALLDKTWVTVGDDRVRLEHQLMAGQTVPFENAFSNGEEIPGESTFNCRCILNYRQRRVA